MNECIEDGRNRIQTSLRGLRNQPTSERKGDVGHRRQRERAVRRDGTNVDVVEEVLEADGRELDANLRRLRKCQ